MSGVAITKTFAAEVIIALGNQSVLIAAEPLPIGASPLPEPDPGQGGDAAPPTRRQVKRLRRQVEAKGWRWG